MTSRTILVTTDNDTLSDFFAEQLSADGYDVLEARSLTDTREQLAAAPDLLVLAISPHALELLRALRGDTLDAHVSPGMAVVTLGPDDELAALRAYEAGSDHHLPADTGYLRLRAVVATVIRRASSSGAARRHRVGRLDVDVAGRRATIGGEPVKLSAREFELLAALASDPTRVFGKDELLRDVWGYEHPVRTRTVDSHATRLRKALAAHGETLVINQWGRGYRLTP